MKKRYLNLSAILLCCLFFIFNCKKAGTGGDASVAVYVKHHDNLISAATVYVKYNAKDSPGDDPGKYDQSVVCGTSGHSKGHAHFKNLKQGYYYFYAVGFDSTALEKVTGGVSLHIKRSERQKEISLDIPVEE